MVLPISDESDRIFGFHLSVATLEGVFMIIVESTKLEADKFKKIEADIPKGQLLLEELLKFKIFVWCENQNDPTIRNDLHFRCGFFGNNSHFLNIVVQ
jgi:hypothetical protein